MDTYIQIHKSSQFGEIRTAGTPEEPLFCLADVCKVLDLQAAAVSRRLQKDVISNHPLSEDPNSKGVISNDPIPSVLTTLPVQTAGGVQQMTFVSEDGLYDAIFDSRKKEAKAFRKWVTSEVLPSIRKNGGYMTAKADDTPEEIMARALTIAKATLENQKKRLAEQSMTIERQEQRIEQQSKELAEAAPKATYYDDTLMSVNTLTMTQAANSIGMSVYSLANKLQEAGVIYRQSGQYMLRVPYCQWELHKTRTNTFTRSDGSTGTSIYLVWTQRGLRFINALNKHNFNVAEAVAELRREKESVSA